MKVSPPHHQAKTMKYLLDIKIEMRICITRDYKRIFKNKLLLNLSIQSPNGFKIHTKNKRRNTNNIKIHWLNQARDIEVRF